MEKIKISLAFMRKLSPGEPVRYADSEIPGFQVRVSPRCVSYYLRKRMGGKLYEVKLGNHPDITLEEARNKALEKLGGFANHKNPEAVSSRTSPIVREAIEFLIQSRSHPQKTKNAMKYWSHLYSKKISDLIPEDIESVFDAMEKTPYAANNAVRYLKAAFNKLFKKLRMPNPVPALFDGITLYPTKPRRRVMQTAESPEIIDKIKDLANIPRYHDQALALLLMIYTGQRKSRVLQMHGKDIDAENRTWYVPGNTNKLPVILPLNEFAWEIIANELACHGEDYFFWWRGKPLKDCRKTFQRVCQDCGIEDLNIHDLRRSLGTWMLSSGASIAEVSKTLGHASIRTTEQVYAHLLGEKGRAATTAAINAMLKGKI